MDISSKEELSKWQKHYISLGSPFIHLYQPIAACVTSEEIDLYVSLSQLEKQISGANELYVNRLSSKVSVNSQFLEDSRICARKPKLESLTYIMGALNLLSCHHSLIERLISKDEQDFMFKVKIFEQGIWKEIAVHDECLFSKGIDGQEEFVGACVSSVTNEYWPVLLEKAYASILGGYGGAIIPTSESDVLTCFTGSPSTISPLFFPKQNQCLDDAIEENYLSAFDTISTGLLRGRLISLIPRKQTEQEYIKNQNNKMGDGIYSGHSYAVLAAKQISTVQDNIDWLVLKLRNPFIDEPWEGEWSDSASKISIRSEMLNSDFDRKDQFWISIKDVLRHFSFVCQCEVGSSKQNSSFEFNMETNIYEGVFKIQIPSAGKYTFSLFQEDIRKKITQGKESYRYACVELFLFNCAPTPTIITFSQRAEIKESQLTMELYSGEYLILVGIKLPDKLTETLHMTLSIHGPSFCDIQIVNSFDNSIFTEIQMIGWQGFAEMNGTTTVVAEVKAPFEGEDTQSIIIERLNITGAAVFFFRNPNIDQWIEIEIEFIGLLGVSFINHCGLVSTRFNLTLPPLKGKIIAVRPDSYIGPGVEMPQGIFFQISYLQAKKIDSCSNLPLKCLGKLNKVKTFRSKFNKNLLTFGSFRSSDLEQVMIQENTGLNIPRIGGKFAPLAPRSLNLNLNPISEDKLEEIETSRDSIDHKHLSVAISYEHTPEPSEMMTIDSASIMDSINRATQNNNSSVSKKMNMTPKCRVLRKIYKSKVPQIIECSSAAGNKKNPLRLAKELINSSLNKNWGLRTSKTPLANSKLIDHKLTPRETPRQLYKASLKASEYNSTLKTKLNCNRKKNCKTRNKSFNKSINEKYSDYKAKRDMTPNSFIQKSKKICKVSSIKRFQKSKSKDFISSKVRMSMCRLREQSSQSRKKEALTEYPNGKTSRTQFISDYLEYSNKKSPKTSRFSKKLKVRIKRSNLSQNTNQRSLVNITHEINANESEQLLDKANIRRSRKDNERRRISPEITAHSSTARLSSFLNPITKRNSSKEAKSNYQFPNLSSESTISKMMNVLYKKKLSFDVNRLSRANNAPEE